MLLSLKKIKTKKTREKLTTKQKQQHHNIAPALYHRWRCCQAITLNDQQVGPTSIAPLLP